MTDSADVVVVGAGIAGLVATLELLEHGRDVVLIDRCKPEEVGGLAREAFGGMFMADTSEQRRSRIPDSVELATADWMRMADFDEADEWPRRWGGPYGARARGEVGGRAQAPGGGLFPGGNWGERRGHPPLAHVELRGRRTAPAAAPPAARAEADPAALRAGARPDRPSVRPRRADPDLRRPLRARAHVRGRPQVLLDDLQLEDRAARARRVRLAAQPVDPREEPRPVPAVDPARQAGAREALRGQLPRLRDGELAAGADE